MKKKEKFFAVEQKFNKGLEIDLIIKEFKFLVDAFAHEVSRLIEPGDDNDDSVYELSHFGRNEALEKITSWVDERGKEISLDYICEDGHVIGVDAIELSMSPEIMATGWDEVWDDGAMFVPLSIRKRPADIHANYCEESTYDVCMYRTENGETTKYVYGLDEIGDAVFVNIFVHLF